MLIVAVGFAATTPSAKNQLTQIYIIIKILLSAFGSSGLCHAFAFPSDTTISKMSCYLCFIFGETQQPEVQVAPLRMAMKKGAQAQLAAARILEKRRSSAPPSSGSCGKVLVPLWVGLIGS